MTMRAMLPESKASATTSSLRCWRREHAPDVRVARLDVSPSPMHPQPEIGIAAHVHLEDVGAALREFADGIGVVGTGRIDRMFVDHPESSAGPRQGKHGNDWCPVRSASAASADVVAAGRLKKST